MYYTSNVYKMKFYNREKEIELLKKAVNSKTTNLVIVNGLRRIGKTRLISHVLEGKEYLYVFTPKDMSLSSFLKYANQEFSIPLFNSSLDFTRYIFEKYEYIFFDEFQNFYFIDKSIYSIVQKYFDEYRRKNKKLSIFVSGSSYSLLNKIFHDYSKALYGRKDIEIKLQEFNLKTCFGILDDLGLKKIEEKIKFWAIFGGIPRFYDMLELFSVKSFDNFLNLFFHSNIRSVFNEGKNILVSEFGGDHKIYFTVLLAIASGKTTLSEIASYFENDTNRTNRYITLLRKEYNLIKRELPVVNKRKAGIYKLKNNFIIFWFNFLKRYEYYIETENFQEIKNIFNKNFNQFLGKIFEEFCINFLKETKFFDFGFYGKQWGKFKGEKGKNIYEFDICAINKDKKEILFGECKWKDNCNPGKIFKELKDKADYVEWNKSNRREKFVIFAKSFSKKIKKNNLILYDLNAIKQIL
ncbi:AAA family ATPase [Candidatus Woesearchaeota archaeon]|nr:AAA family ATPase [Candidatus Woesearchaeota archaeon]